MEFNVAKEFESMPALQEMKRVLGNPRNDIQRATAKALQGATMEIGMSGDGRYSAGGAWDASPIYVHPSMIGQNLKSQTMDAMYARDPNSVGYRYQFNRETKKFDMVWDSAKNVKDAATNLIGGQLLSPNSISWFNDVARRPLVYSKARQMVSIWTGTDPWAEVMSLGLEDYSGLAGISSAGSVGNNDSVPVEVTTGLQTSPVINITVTYNLSIEELERARSNNAAFPFGGQLIAHKQSYARWAQDIVTDQLIYYGFSPTGTQGLLNINAITPFNSGTSLSDIAASGSTTKGYDMYIALADVIQQFMTTSVNLLNTINIAMSPLAFNLLREYPYSAEFNPQAAIKTLIDNFLAGAGVGGETPTINLISDPLLAANNSGQNIYNLNSFDYLVISSPEIQGGPDDQPNQLTRFGMPIPEFAYPVIPGQYTTPYKFLRRVAGVFAPYTPAVKVYQGFGV